MQEHISEDAKDEIAASIVLDNSSIQLESNFEDFNISKWYLISKRFIDIVGAIVGIIVLSPILIIVAIFIKIEDSKGSIFFSQKRVGQNGKEFKMYKFRSMVHNAEELKENLLKQNERSGPMFKMKNDPRVTKV